jgi:hypothetical protein
MYLVMVRFPGEPSEALACLELDPARGIVAKFGEPDQGMLFDKVVANKMLIDIARLFPHAIEVFLRCVR